jgi:hypothetical protein
MNGWNSSHNPAILAPCTDLFFTEFPRVLETTSKEFSKRYTQFMVPFYANEELIASKIDLLL